MFDLAFLQIVMRAVASIVLLTILAGSIAATARLLGDNGPGYDGRLTLNPFRHLDPFGLVAGTFALSGWAKPVAIDPATMRLGRLGPILCAAAGVAAVLVVGLAVLFLEAPIARYWPASSAAFMAALISTIAKAARAIAIFNLLPFPPLAGGFLLLAVAPGIHAWLIARMTWVSFVLAVIILLLGRFWSNDVPGSAVAALGLG